MAEISAWRVSDVVAYDAMREFATTLTALLLGSADQGIAESDAALVEAADRRHDVLTVDGCDRGAVDALAARISDRITQLTGAPL